MRTPAPPPPPPPTLVTMCVCRDVSLSDVVRMSLAGMTFDQICNRTGCCSACGTCEAYVRTAIERKEGAVELMSVERADEVIAAARRRDKQTGPGDSPGA